MNTDLWMDLGNPANRRGHPLLLALLHVFCPAAAQWWLAGADPVVPFDPLWQAHYLRARGRTLREVLEKWGLGALMPAARKYVEQVEAFREQPQHRHVRAPELLPTFLGGRLSIQDRHGSDRAAEQIGGWQNFFPLIRSWAFTLQDWQRELGINGVATMTPRQVSSGDCFGEPLTVSTWVLKSDRKSFRGLFAPVDFRGGWLLEVLLHCLPPEPGTEFLAFSESGRIFRAGAGFGIDVIREVVALTGSLVRRNPGLPLNAFGNPSLCRGCGYRQLCWGSGENGLTPLALGRKGP